MCITSNSVRVPLVSGVSHRSTGTCCNTPPRAARPRIVRIVADMDSGSPLSGSVLDLCQHLPEALAAWGADCAEEPGPALPLGDDFTGIVCLHGALDRRPGGSS
jgi:hypothetical protein